MSNFLNIVILLISQIAKNTNFVLLIEKIYIVFIHIYELLQK